MKTILFFTVIFLTGCVNTTLPKNTENETYRQPWVLYKTRADIVVIDKQ